MPDFAPMQDRINVAVLSHLGDDATLDGESLRGLLIFPKEGSRLAGYPTGAKHPEFHLRNESAEAVTLDAVLICRGASYRVVHIERDRDGLAVLILRAA